MNTNTLIYEKDYAWIEEGGLIYEYGKTVVYLINEEDYEYCEEHPVIGSDYECSGIVCGPGANNKLSVRWDNGCRNVYLPEDLDIVFYHNKMGEENPNKKFKQVKYLKKMKKLDKLKPKKKSPWHEPSSKKPKKPPFFKCGPGKPVKHNPQYLYSDLECPSEIFSNSNSNIDQ